MDPGAGASDGGFVAMRRLIQNVRREDGMALVITLIFTAVLLVFVGSTMYYSTANQDSAAYSRSNQTAFSLAEAGQNNAVSVIMGAIDPQNTGLLPPKSAAIVDTTTYPGATIKWWGSYNAPTKTWTVTGRGEVPAPNSDATIRRTISQDIRIAVKAAAVAGNPAWAGIFVDNKNRACLNLNNSTVISYTLYTTGDVCMDNTAQIAASASPVQIAGGVTLANQASVGTASTPVAAFHVGLGCKRGSGGFTFPCTSAQKVYATAQDQVVPAVPKPPLDLAGWYANAKPGPKNACTTGSFPGGFDNDGALNRSRADVDLFPATSYDCRYVSGTTTVGQITWNASAKTFVINGVVLFDGDIEMSDSEAVLYSGRGSIYATGRIAFNNSQSLCGAVSGGGCNFTPGAWDPEANLLVLVAGSSTDDPDFSFNQSSQFQGARYAATGYSEGQSTHVQGPVVANTAQFAQSSAVVSFPYATLAPGQPGGTSTITPEIVPGSWREVNGP